MRRRHWLLGTAAVICCGHRHAMAQPDWRRVAVPVVPVGAFVAAALQQFWLPRAMAFAERSAALKIAAAGGSVAALRQALAAARVDWAALSAVPVGPLLERRSARRIDFNPTRADAVRRAAGALAGGTLDANTVGGPAKGFGGLAWLADTMDSGSGAEHALWPPYAAWVAADIDDEAQALRREFGAAAAAPPTDEAATAHFETVLNQWVGGVQALRLSVFERPTQAPGPAGGSTLAVAEARAQWDSLQALARWADGSPASIEAVLRGRGLNLLADRLHRQLAAAGRAVAAARPADAASRRAASNALDRLRALAEAEVAPALDVRLGFSDRDGD